LIAQRTQTKAAEIGKSAGAISASPGRPRPMPPFLRDCAALLSRWHGHRVRNEIEQGEATADAISSRDAASGDAG
jgi:hypothetical protein